MTILLTQVGAVTGLLFVVVCIIMLGTRREASGFRVPKVAEGNPMMHAENIIVINNPMHIKPEFAANYFVGQLLRKGRWFGSCFCSHWDRVLCGNPPPGDMGTTANFPIMCIRKVWLVASSYNFYQTA